MTAAALPPVLLLILMLLVVLGGLVLRIDLEDRRARITRWHREMPEGPP